MTSNSVDPFLESVAEALYEVRSASILMPEFEGDADSKDLIDKAPYLVDFEDAEASLQSIINMRKKFLQIKYGLMRDFHD